MPYTAEELAQHMENDCMLVGWDEVPAMLRSQATELASLRETLNFIATRFSSDWPERCQTKVLAAQHALTQWPNIEFSAAAEGQSTATKGYPAPAPTLACNVRNHMETLIQPKVTGYRKLSEAEVALMNEGKALAEQCGAYIAKLRKHDDANRTMSLRAGVGPALDHRWISIGAIDLQRGFMAVIRGIAQPTTF